MAICKGTTGADEPTGANRAPGAIDPNRIRRSAYRWNTTAGILFACQSVAILIVLTRVCSVYEAGIFTIAFANANLFLNLGKFGMRKFQASDRQREFTFAEYRTSRLLTSAAMIVAGAGFVMWSALTLGYAAEKTFVMVVMCLFKAVDAIEDVYSGAYQLQDRLDVGARMVTIRLATTMVVFGVLIVAFGALAPALVLSTVFTAVLFAAQVAFVKRRYRMPDRTAGFAWRRVGRLLRECLPLFISTFLLYYIGNAPKYAIDALLDDAAQAYYGYVSMPAFVVSLLAGFVYNPLITELTDQWQSGDVRAFTRRFARLSLVVIALTAACVAAGWLVGVPVLDVLYNADTGPYLAELLILVAGGGFLALATLVTLGITIIRLQNALIPIYCIASVAAFVLSNWMVGEWGVLGAASAYIALMALLALALAAVFAIGTRTENAR